MQKQNNISEDIQLLIIDFLQNRIDQENLTVLNSWLAESENNVSLFNEFKTYWLLTAKKQNEKILTDKALLNVKSALNESKIPKRFLWNTYKIAASWLIVFILGSGLTSYYFSHFSEKNNLEGNTSVFAPLGSTSYLDLPDGSKVWLNAGSKITYNNNFGKKSRILELTGEAFFNVKTNPKKPFLVVTSDLIVKATGTRFNVKAYPEEKTITTTLVEGKVIIEPVLKSEKNEIVVLKQKRNGYILP
ncbi:MAG: FecR domain-containing protein [Bacteroidetes bacterium]|nr:FecR domain-containing protein [Bacteroidota bacterium]